MPEWIATDMMQILVKGKTEDLGWIQYIIIPYYQYQIASYKS